MIIVVERSGLCMKFEHLSAFIGVAEYPKLLLNLLLNSFSVNEFEALRDFSLKYVQKN